MPSRVGSARRILILGPLGFLKFGDVSKCIYFLIILQPKQPGAGWQAPSLVEEETAVVRWEKGWPSDGGLSIPSLLLADVPIRFFFLRHTNNWQDCEMQNNARETERGRSDPMIMS